MNPAYPDDFNELLTELDAISSNEPTRTPTLPQLTAFRHESASSHAFRAGGASAHSGYHYCAASLEGYELDAPLTISGQRLLNLLADDNERRSTEVASTNRRRGDTLLADFILTVEFQSEATTADLAHLAALRAIVESAPAHRSSDEALKYLELLDGTARGAIYASDLTSLTYDPALRQQGDAQGTMMPLGCVLLLIVAEI